MVNSFNLRRFLYNDNDELPAMINWIKKLFAGDTKPAKDTTAKATDKPQSAHGQSNETERDSPKLQAEPSSDIEKATDAISQTQTHTAANAQDTDISGAEKSSAEKGGIENNSDEATTPSLETALAEIEKAKDVHRQGRIDIALPVYQRLQQQFPQFADAWHMLGIVALQEGDLSKAKHWFEGAIERDAKVANYHVNLGICLAGMSQLEPALVCFDAALNLEPDNESALANSASAYLDAFQFDNAKQVIAKLKQVVPNSIDGYRLMSSVLLAEKNTLAAIDELESAYAIEPSSIDLLLQLISCYELQNNVAKANQYLQKAVSLQPGNPKVIMFQGILLRRQGEPEKASKTLAKALKYGLDEQTAIEANHQLGLACDESAQYPQAFTAFTQSNQLMSRMTRAAEQGDNYFAMLADYKQVTNLVSQDNAHTDDTSAPIFFVAFPRSGTTLMEQVLKAHPSIATTDERSPITLIINQISNEFGDYPASLTRLTDDDKQRFRSMFWQHVKSLYADIEQRQLIDKLPLNIVHLPLIRSLFSQAKFIVAVRDPRDVVLSCFMQKFDLNAAMVNFLDLNKAADMYQQVMTLWQDYKQQLSTDDYIEYRYEDLVTDFNGTVEQVLAFTGLDWHDDMQQYRQKALARNIATPSYRDVTNKISDKAVARHKNYEQQLAPVADTLKPFIELYGYQP
ncbi:sulfotransferase family protein [Thalassotalea sp. HSM 43]|nr:sulfotransferase family protein [Thalassotalea sp. HSM 43]